MAFFSFKRSPHFIEQLWDAWCILSIIGIWPRYIEPSLLHVSHHKINIPALPNELDGLKVVQISDLHISPYITDDFLKRISLNIQKIAPDIIVFTGDLLCYSKLTDQARLKNFLSSLHAPLGCFAIYGNHDYSQYVSLAEDGKVRLIHGSTPALLSGFKRLLCKEEEEIDPEIHEPLQPQEELQKLFEDANFQVLHNQTVQVGTGFHKLNIIGLGDLMAKQCLPNQAFLQADLRFPSIVLSHNPDSYSMIKGYPADVILCGHTHGGQVNLPFIWKKITPIKNKRFKSGLFELSGKTLYVNRGLGATFPFRWFAPPEIASFTLVKAGLKKIPLWYKLLHPQKEEEQELAVV